MAKPLAIDNSKLREQARQQRQELARLQQPTEKQPTKNLFGPPIPVSRPNDPTFEQLSNFFGSPVGADISCFRSSVNNDISPSDKSQSRNHKLAGSRHGDVRHAEQDDSRRVEHRLNDSRHGDTRQTDARQGDARHGDTTRQHGDARHRDCRPNDNRNICSGEPAAKNSRPGPGATTPSLLEPCAEPLRQGVFEQFVKSSSRKTPSAANSDKAPKPLAFRQSMTEDKMKHRMDSFRDSKPDESSVSNRSNGSANSKLEHQSKQPTTNQSKYSSIHSPESSQTSSSFPSKKTNDVKNKVRNSPFSHRTNLGKDCEKISSGRVNGTFHDVDLNGKNSELEKKLTLRIPQEYEKSDDFVTKVLQEVSIRSPLTGILTPKKADIPFPFPDTNQQCIETIPKGHLSSDQDDGNEEAADKVEREPVQRPEHLFDSTGKTIPNQSLNLLDGLDISDSSDSENEEMDTNNVDERTPDGAGQRSVTDQKPSGAVSLVEDVLRSRRLSESSEASSSEEESCSSGSESDSSQSENEEDKEMKLVEVEKYEGDKAEDKQSKRTSWEIKNFIPKSNEHVPFNSLLPSSPSSPFANAIRQMSNDDFDIDIDDPIKKMYMMSQEQVLSPLPIPTSDVENPESDHSGDAACLLIPKILPSPSITNNVQHPVAPPPVDLSHVDFARDVQEPGCYTHSPAHSTSFSASISGVDYCSGKPSVVVRIRRSYLLKKAKKAKFKDSVVNSTCKIPASAQVSNSTVSSKSAVQTDYRSPVHAGCEPDLTGYSPESVLKFNKSSIISNSSLPRSASCRSSRADGSTTRTLGSTPKQTSAAPTPSPVESVPADRKEQMVENSPAKIGQYKNADDIYLLATKATKRKSDDVGRSDQKKICDRNSLSRKEDRKSQSQLRNGNPDSSQKLLLIPNLKGELKSPVTNGEDNNSKSSSSSQAQKRTEKMKTPDGHEKMCKASIGKVNGKITNPETLNSVSVKNEKIATPVVNGIGESPSHPNPNICCDDGLSGNLTDDRKRSADLDDIDHLHFNQKNSLNGIKRVKYESEKLESSDVYMLNARKLKHEGDSRPDKFSKVLSYTESVLAFVCHCSALEAELAELARIQKMYQDTLALCQYIVRVMESVVTPKKYHLIVISLRIQAIISLRLYNIRKSDVAKLKSVLDEHNKSHMSKPLQIPSPYQTNHHHSTNTTAVGWNHTNGTPSPRSPRPSPSPAGSIGSVGSAGSSNGDSGMVKPMPFANGHSLASIVVPQRIPSVMMSFLNYMNYLHQCHDFWDQAEAFLTTHPTVGDFFHSVDTEFGPIDLHSSTLAIVRYASEVVKHVKSEAKRLSQVVRTD